MRKSECFLGTGDGFGAWGYRSQLSGEICLHGVYVAFCSLTSASASSLFSGHTGRFEESVMVRL